VVAYAKRRDYLLLSMAAPLYRLSIHLILVSAGMNYLNNTTDLYNKIYCVVPNNVAICEVWNK